MSPAGVLTISTAAACAGTVLVGSGLRQHRPSLRRALGRIRREADGEAVVQVAVRAQTRLEHALEPLSAALAERAPALLPGHSELRLIGRSPGAHVMIVGLAALGGLLGPAVVLGALRLAGWVHPAAALPIGLSVLGSMLAVAAVHVATVERARRSGVDLRNQLAAFLDLVTMLLVANLGHEAALHEAAATGDGRLFRELRRRLHDADASGRSAVDALELVGVDLGLEELALVAATVRLAAAEGAPVARTLAARCATVRSVLATEHEAEARLRTSRLSTPVVGMALIFMALVIYPALDAV